MSISTVKVGDITYFVCQYQNNIGMSLVLSKAIEEVVGSLFVKAH